MLASASGEQLGLSAGMTSLLIVPGLPGPGIVCVPDIVMSLDGGCGAHAAKPAAIRIVPTKALARFMIILATIDILSAKAGWSF
jgi:hypothetical protein